MSGNNIAVQTRSLQKTFANGVEALKGIDLEVKKGEVFCLLGPNGAGKTTLTRILATQLKATAGEVTILGLDLNTEATRIRDFLAAVPQQSNPYHSLKVHEQIFYYLVARGIRRAEARERTRRVTDELGLTAKYNEEISALSGGQRRRVLLCMALASGAEFLLLDEPTAGLDVLIRRELWDNLARTKKDRTVFLTTHSMAEAEALADRIGVVNEGRLVAVGTLNELLAMAPGSEKVVFDEDSFESGTLEEYGHTQRFAGKWAVFPKDRDALHGLLDLCMEHGAEASVLRSNLEDVFVYLVGQDYKLKLGELR